MSKMKRIPEKDNGNVEYKVKLTEKSSQRIENVTSQMRFRCIEGDGECIYVLGVKDCGEIVGITASEFKETLKNLHTAANKNAYIATLISSQEVSGDKKTYELLIREDNPQQYIDLKVVITGAVDAGKSSLLGFLISGQTDDGRGSARVSVFNFAHEVRCGRTSSISQHILGFNTLGQITNHKARNWPEIVRLSAKIITFFDHPGHRRYLKTATRGLTGIHPDICLIVVGANMGTNDMTKEHLFLCLALKIPFAFIITKIDICKDRVAVATETLNAVKKLCRLSGIRRIPFVVKTQDDILLAVKNIHRLGMVPIFRLSNVTGEGMQNLKSFLNLVPCKKQRATNLVACAPVELQIERSFQVPGTGIVVGGQLVSGHVKVGDQLLMGPYQGEYYPTTVRSIHLKRVPVHQVTSGCYVCFALKKIPRKFVRRGSVLICHKNVQVTSREINAEIRVVRSHSTTIRTGFEPIIHVNNIRRSAKILRIQNKVNGRRSSDEDDALRTGDQATVTFQFRQAEYVKPGHQLIFCDGTVKGTGTVI